MPRRVGAFYDALAAAAPDANARAGVRRERDFLELAYLRGEVPPEAEFLFDALDGPTLAKDVAAFDDSLTADLSDEDVERIATGNVERMRERLGDRLPDVAHALDVEVMGRLYELFLATGNDRDRRLGKAVVTKLVAMIEEVRSDEVH